ncbi:restriction endonuclease, SacI family [Megasphaera sp.]|jgi:hypothetical protein|uniref:restriction endonuclease, SacI family n=1 Tax=Megasphaera sp. TaxID=2023260 RepID=UPI0040253157
MGMKEAALKKLQEAYATANYNPNTTCNHKEFIDYVIDNTHLTYKYVLFTALLSKATDENINPLCLQKKSKLPGAYDARTICHKVIVPFEMETLKKVLGGSNEPFLNKPARFPELSKTNAVRRGNDQCILNALCDYLPTIRTSQDAYQCLVYLLCKLIKIRDTQKDALNFCVRETSNTPATLWTYIDKALTQSYEGEVLTLMVAGVYHLAYMNRPNAIVEVHPVNQSGASGREISDLDIYVNNTLVASNELKDKNFSESDVRHATDKVLTAGGNHMLFIFGPRACPESDFIDILEKEYLDKNFFLRVISYNDFFANSLNYIDTINSKEFMKFILQVAHNTKFKEETIEYLEDLGNEVLGLKHI